MSIPQINLAETKDLPSAVDSALTSHGFFRIINSDIDAQLSQRVFECAADFFEGEPQAHIASAYGTAAENFGYQAVCAERLDPKSPPDIKHTFTMRNVLNKPPLDSRWPSQAFANLMSTFFRSAFKQALTLQHALSQALGLPKTFFARHHSGENVTLRLLHYPPQDGQDIADGQLGAGAHTDYGLLTLLLQDAIGGLQVRGPNNEWQDVEPQPGSIIVNAGDLLERWTNGRYRSALHRVQPIIGNRARQSIVLFVDPDSATPVSVLPSCVDAENPARYPTITAGEHLLERIAASHR